MRTVLDDMPGGQGFLSERLKPNPEFEVRTWTGIALWASGLFVMVTQYFGPLGYKMSAHEFAVIFSGVIVMFVFTAIVYPRASPRVFVIIEQFELVIAWVILASQVALTGGASSGVATMFAFAMFYTAYFHTLRVAAPQLALGVLFMLAPFAYDRADALTVEFAQSIFITIAVLLAMCVMVFVRRRRMIDAECRTRRMALTDPLTGVANTRVFNEAGQFRLEQCLSTGDSFGLAIVDLDGLKRANTAFGHVGGDAMIVTLAQCLKAASGARDQVARIGGDEFSVLLHSASHDELNEWSARLTSQIQRRNENANGDRAQISASVGMARFPADGETIEQLIDAADTRMYEHKASAQKNRNNALELRTKETSGGRHLGASRPNRRRRAKLGEGVASAAVASAVWISGSALLLLGTLIPGASLGDTTAVLTLAAVFLTIGLVSLAGVFRFTAMVLRVSDTASVVVIAPSVIITGGPESPMLPLAVLATAYVAYFKTPRAAAVPITALLTAFSVGFWWQGGVSPLQETLYMNLLSVPIVISYILQYNARKLASAEAAAEQMALLDP
ncbi:MAG: GGDEF domain-containing protein, partial [Solirubrobacterales bacterium]